MYCREQAKEAAMTDHGSHVVPAASSQRADHRGRLGHGHVASSRTVDRRGLAQARHSPTKATGPSATLRTSSSVTAASGRRRARLGCLPSWARSMSRWASTRPCPAMASAASWRPPSWSTVARSPTTARCGAPSRRGMPSAGIPLRRPGSRSSARMRSRAAARWSPTTCTRCERQVCRALPAPEAVDHPRGMMQKPRGVEATMIEPRVTNAFQVARRM